MKIRPLLFAVPLLLFACTKETAPVRLYFIASSRFTSGNRLRLQPADTLATRLFAAADSANGHPLSRVGIKVIYTPTYQPFVYPQPITAFIYGNVAAGQEVTYLDSSFAAASRPDQVLLTSVFGVRTTTGSEQWVYTATDTEGRTSARSFTATVRRADSLDVFNDYTLRLNVPTRGTAARRFLQLRPGLALPAYAVLGAAAPSLAQDGQQKITDLIQSADGLRLYSPDVIDQYAQLSALRWPTGNRRKTRFSLTQLSATQFGEAKDTIAIRQQFQAPGTGQLTNLTVNQVYAFHTESLASAGLRGVYGLLRVASVPGGTTAGLQLQIRTAKLRP